MSDQFLATRRGGWKKYSATAITSASVPALADVLIATYPVPTGAFENTCSTGNKTAANTFIDFMPYGVGTASQTLDLRVVGWCMDPTGLRWIPTTLGRVTATLSAVVLTGTSNKTCDTIAITEGEDGVTITEQTNASGYATFRVDVSGSEYITVDGAIGSATSYNLFYRGV